MELTPGFKLSEAGPIPEDWEAVRLGDSQPFVTSGSRGWSRYYAETGDLFVRITNMFRDDVRLNLCDVRFVQPAPQDAEVERTALQLNDLLISITADIGIVSLVTGDVPLPAFVNQHVAAVRLAPDTIDPLYAAYALKTGHSSAWFRAITDAGAKAGINLTTVRETPIIAPPLPEQRAIAEVLGDIDAWITAAEAEVAKLASVKAAAMDALLTPTTRLRGFGGEWVLRRFGDVAQIRNRKVQTFGNHLARTCVDLEQIISVQGCVGTFADVSAQSSMRYAFEAGDVLFGRLRAYLEKYWSADRAGVCSTEIWPLIPRGDELAKELLAWIVRTPDFIDAASVAFGTHMPRADWGYISDQEFLIPANLTEQRAVAAILNEIDTSLAAARTVVSKARSVKAAAMDALLSGRIRLQLS